MTEEINDQISAFVDDELSEEEAAFLVRRFEHDPEARGRVMRYTVIGAALRSELLQPDPAILRRRIAGAMSGTPLPAARVVGARWPARFARPLLGVSIAASVALGAIVGLRALNEVRDGAGPGVAVTQGAIQAREVAAPSYVVPQEISAPNAATPPHRLTNYLVRHGEYASGLNRTSVHSNVVGAAEEAARDGAAEPAAFDESAVGARR